MGTHILTLEPLPDARSLTLDFLALKILRSKFLVFINYLLYNRFKKSFQHVFIYWQGSHAEDNLREFALLYHVGLSIDLLPPGLMTRAFTCQALSPALQ